MTMVTKREILKYTLLPGFKPRFKELFASGFRYVAYFIALVFGAVRLLPNNHVYMDARNMGRFGIVHVIAEAANNIKFERKNIDQIILFACVLIGLALIIFQLLLMATAVFVSPAMAAAGGFLSGMPAGGFFTTTPAQQTTDLAGMMMDMVFGVPDIFNSCVAQTIACKNAEGNDITASVGNPAWMLEGNSFPMPFHQALHQMFQFYSIGLLVVAVLIMIYFIATIILETAESGTPFGKRFNRVWAPVRFVVAFGLLVPIGYGLNSSQYIVLYAAKFGSGFATNGWEIFNNTLNSASVTNVSNLVADTEANSANNVAQPNPPEVGTLLQFLFTAKTCAEMESIYSDNATQVMPYFVDNPFACATCATGPNLPFTQTTTYEQVIAFANGKNQMLLRFGVPNKADHGHMMGWVAPTCGEMVYKLTDPRPSGSGPDNADPGVEAMQRYYLFVIRELWYETFNGTPNANFLDLLVGGVDATQNYPLHYVRVYGNKNQDTSLPLPVKSYKSSLQDLYATDLYNAMNDPGASGLDGITGTSLGAIEEMSLAGRWEVDQTLLDYGWAGAAIWYNRIAEMNGQMTTAVLNIPQPNLYPDVMEHVAYKKRQSDRATTHDSRMQNTVAGGQSASVRNTDDPIKAKILWEAYNFWQTDGNVSTPHNTPMGNASSDIINSFLGTSGLYDMRRNANVHPLAQLSALGKSLVEGAIRNLTYAAIGGAAGAGLGQISKFIGESASVFASLLVTLAMIGLTVGVILFYVLPFLPFIYFTFAVGGWVKGIFEAMVGAPLWALAHIRISGEGLAGQAAVSGYFLIFEIFLRPILMVFGLLASISIFAALVAVLNQIFDLVVANVAGFDVEAEYQNIGGQNLMGKMRQAIDEFFYTVIYAIIVYMMGMSSFKLIDLIPNNILRWMGQTVATFNDQREDAAQSMVGTLSIGTQQTLSSAGQGLKGLTQLARPSG